MAYNNQPVFFQPLECLTHFGARHFHFFSKGTFRRKACSVLQYARDNQLFNVVDDRVCDRFVTNGTKQGFYRIWHGVSDCDWRLVVN